MYCSPNIVQEITSRGMRWAGHVARMGERRVLVRKPEGKSQLWRFRLKSQDNIKMDLKEVGSGGWHGLDQAG
jgi:hypothetical protein